MGQRDGVRRRAVEKLYLITPLILIIYSKYNKILIIFSNMNVVLIRINRYLQGKVIQEPFILNCSYVTLFNRSEYEERNIIIIEFKHLNTIITLQKLLT